MTAEQYLASLPASEQQQVRNHLDYHDPSRARRGKVYVCFGGK